MVKLKEGNMFGELALLNTENRQYTNARRKATIKCDMDCYLAVLDKKSFEIMKRKQESLYDAKLELIKNIPFFDKTTYKQLLKLSWNFKELRFNRNHVVATQGQPLEFLHLVTEGEFECREVKRFHSESGQGIIAKLALQKRKSVDDRDRLNSRLKTAKQRQSMDL